MIDEEPSEDELRYRPPEGQPGRRPENREEQEDQPDLSEFRERYGAPPS